MKINFITAQIDGIDPLLEMMQDYYQYDQIDFNYQGAHRAVTELLSNSNFGNIWLISSDEVIVGYCVLTLGYSLEFQGRDAFIDEIYLKAQYRGQGIGQMAINFLEEECCRLGVRALHLEVAHNNKPAQALYYKASFTMQDRLLMTKIIGNEDRDKL